MHDSFISLRGLTDIITLTIMLILKLKCSYTTNHPVFDKKVFAKADFHQSLANSVLELSTGQIDDALVNLKDNGANISKRA